MIKYKQYLISVFLDTAYTIFSPHSVKFVLISSCSIIFSSSDAWQLMRLSFKLPPHAIQSSYPVFKSLFLHVHPSESGARNKELKSVVLDIPSH